jgi:hypothetical protein
MAGERSLSTKVREEIGAILDRKRACEPTLRERLANLLRSVHKALLLLYEGAPLLIIGAVFGLAFVGFGFLYGSLPLLGFALVQFLGCFFGLFVQICAWGANRPPSG